VAVRCAASFVPDVLLWRVWCEMIAWIPQDQRLKAEYSSPPPGSDISQRVMLKEPWFDESQILQVD
jgi:hypothetical protein